MNYEIEARFLVPKLQALLLEKSERIFELERDLALRDAAIDQLTHLPDVESVEAKEGPDTHAPPILDHLESVLNGDGTAP